MSDILRYARSLVLAHADMKFLAEGKTWVNFTLTEWDERLKHRLPYLAFVNPTNSSTLSVGLWVGPGKQADRENILRMAKERRLSGVPNTLSICDKTRQYCKVSCFDLLNISNNGRTPEEVEALISLKWDEFLKRELPRIVEAVRQEKWLWEVPV